MNLYVVLLLLCAILGEVFTAVPETLRLVQIIFRHGDRTPSEDFPTNPYGEDDWPNGFGQLTQLGMRQQRQLGQFFRQRYDGFLNSTYVRKQVYVRSSDKDRTLQSASALLAGLYPPAAAQRWADDIQWQPVPVHTRPVDDDIEMTVDVSCAAYEKLYAQALTSPEAQTIYSDNKEMLEYVAKNAGFDRVFLPDIWKTFDPLFCMQIHNYTWPGWVTPEAYQLTKDLAYGPEYYLREGYSPAIIRFRSGPFLKMMTDRFREKIANQTDPDFRAYLYSSHDSMLAALMFGLDIWNHAKPPYASGFLFELHQDKQGVHYVEIYYKNNTLEDPMGDPVQITIPGCEFRCPFDRLLTLLDDKLYKGTVADWRAECDGTDGLSGAYIAVGVLSVCFVVGLLLVLILYLRSRSNHGYQRV